MTEWDKDKPKSIGGFAALGAVVAIPTNLSSAIHVWLFARARC